MRALPRSTRRLSYLSSVSTTGDLPALISTVQSLHQTKQSHAFALINGFLPQSIAISASLILRYATFHDLTACRRLFNQTLPFSFSAFLWNTLIRALSTARVDDGLETYNQMARYGIRPDDHTIPFILKTCTNNLNVKKGFETHGVAVKLGFDLDVFVGNTLLSFYGICGGLMDVKKVFDEMPERDIVSWNTVIGVFSINEFYLEALDLFSEMSLSSEFRPNLVSVVSVLPVCAGLEDSTMGMKVHCYVVKVGLDFQLKVGNALIDMYGKCGIVNSSQQVFDEMVERNEVSWNAIITSFAYLGRFKDALEILRSMIHDGKKPNSVTISSVLPVLVELELFDLGMEIHGFSLRVGLESDVFIANSLIDMYAKSGHSFKASNVFDQMGERNVVSWNAMVANFAQNGLESSAIELVREMQADSVIPNCVTFTNVLPACARVGFLHSGKEIHGRAIRSGYCFDLFVSNALTDMYAKCGYLNLARNVFDISIKDEVSYNILVVGYSHTTACSESLGLFLEMGFRGMRRDIISYVGAISACANLADLKKGKEVHGLAIRNHLHAHLFIANSLLDCYIKCGRIDIAAMVFERIPNRDAASWNSMILGYGMRSEFNIAIDLFEAMKEDGVEYDSVSYIAVLSACSHGGLVEKGKKYFQEMQAQNIKPEQMHYACMVDLLGRSGHLEEAVNIINRLPIEPDANVWGALLGACRIHGNIELARRAAEHLFELKPQHCGYYAILSNMYAEAGKWDEAREVRELMKSRGAKKNPGCSWVQIEDEVHAFVAGERMVNLDLDKL